MSAKRISFPVGDFVGDDEVMAMVGHHVDAVSPGKGRKVSAEIRP